MSVNGVVFQGGNLVLYLVADDGWNEIEGPAPQPSFVAPLASIPVPAAPGPVIFSSANMNTFINQESLHVGGRDIWAGDNIAVPQECVAQRSKLYWVAGGKIITSVKRFSFLSFLASLS